MDYIEVGTPVFYYPLEGVDLGVRAGRPIRGTVIDGEGPSDTPELVSLGTREKPAKVRLFLMVPGAQTVVATLSTDGRPALGTFNFGLGHNSRTNDALSSTSSTPRTSTSSTDDGKTLGQVGFEAYNAKKGGLTYDGKEIPPWSEVGQDVRDAWEANALAIEERLTKP